jgi:signal recognition particle subunit SEC65
MKLTNTQRQGSFKDEGYRLLGDRIKLITEPSALEAMIKFYTSDLNRLKGLNKPIPAVLKANLHAVKERARELGYKPKELLQRHNPILETSTDFHAMTKEVLANLKDLQKKREKLDRIFKLDVIG